MTPSIDREDTLSYSLLGHEEVINSVSFSPDGKTIASASGDKTVKLWSVEGNLLHTLSGHTKAVWRARYSPASGKMIASASLDNTVKLWSADTGDLITTLTGHTEGVADISFSPDSQTIATASWDGTIRLWCTRTGNQLDKLGGKAKEINSIDFAPDGIRLASGGYQDGSVKLWDLRTGSAKVLGRHRKPVNCVRFSSDGNTLASGSHDGIIKIWKEEQLMARIKAHEKFIYEIAFSSDGNQFASVSTDTSIKLWTVEGTLLRRLVGHCGEVYGIDFISNNTTSSFILVSASEDKTVRLWSKKNCQQDGCHGYSEHTEFNQACQEAIKKANRRLGLEALREQKIDVVYRISRKPQFLAAEGPETLAGFEVWVTEVTSFKDDRGCKNCDPNGGCSPKRCDSGGCSCV